MGKKVKGMKLARTNEKEINSLLRILTELEDLYKYDLKNMHFENVDFSEYEILKNLRRDNTEDFLDDLIQHLAGIHFQRILWNCDTMLRNCSDPDLSYLDFSPEIKKGLSVLEALKDQKELEDLFAKNADVYAGEIDQQVMSFQNFKDLIEKLLNSKEETDAQDQ
ncbi:MAG: hypothetical protein WCD31_14525 [Gillisia sp.]